MVASFAVELKKLYKRPATWIAGSVFVVLVVVVVYLLRYLFVTQANSSPQVGRYVASLYPENLIVNALATRSNSSTVAWGPPWRWCWERSRSAASTAGTP